MFQWRTNRSCSCCVGVSAVCRVGVVSCWWQQQGQLVLLPQEHKYCVFALSPSRQRRLSNSRLSLSVSVRDAGLFWFVVPWLPWKRGHEHSGGSWWFWRCALVQVSTRGSFLPFSPPPLLLARANQAALPSYCATSLRLSGWAARGNGFSNWFISPLSLIPGRSLVGQSCQGGEGEAWRGLWVKKKGPWRELQWVQEPSSREEILWSFNENGKLSLCSSQLCVGGLADFSALRWCLLCAFWM